MWQILLEIYIKIFEEAREHFFELSNDLEIDEYNLVLFIKVVLLLDAVDSSLQAKGLFETLINYKEENYWIKFYLLLLSFKNKKRILEILEELLNMKDEMQDKLLLPKIYVLISEIYKEIDESKWKQYLEKAFELNPHDLYLQRFRLKYGLIEEEEFSNSKLYRIFPEDLRLINEYYQKKKKNKPNKNKGFRFFCWGGGNIGASSYLVSYEGINILLDAGALIKDKNLYYNSIEDLPISLKDVDLVIVTHAHLDHSGGILELLKEGSNCPIIVSKPTYEILKEGFLKGQKNVDLERKWKDILAKGKFIIYEKGQKETLFIKDKVLNLMLFPAGHILGAVSVLIEIDSMKIFYTGDFSLEDVETNEGLSFPLDLQVDVLITEATYGYGSNFGIKNKFLQNKLLLLALEELVKEQERVLLPVYAIGKGQDLLLLLRKKFQYVPFNVYVDGEIAFFSKLYEKFVGSIYGNGILSVEENISYMSREDFIRREISLGNCVVTASSNDLKKGSVSFLYATEMQNFDKGCILNLESNAKEFIGIKNYQLGLLNHATIADILELVIELTPSIVFIVHRGYANDSKINIETLLRGIAGLQVFVPQEGEIIDI